MKQDQTPDGPRSRGPARWVGLLGAALLLVAALGFTALGLWQLQRLEWKQALIARVQQGLAQSPVPLEPRNSAAQEYQRVWLEGEFDHARETLVGASTVLGSGYWLMTPLRSAGGDWTWVNRGFVPRRDTERQRPAGTQRIEGLLRLSEAGGRLLQRNEAQSGRWYSRDVQALSQAAGLPAGSVASHFIDVWPEPPGSAYAQLAGSGDAVLRPPSVWPHPGLTVLRFSNNHRSYALTWFALAAMSVGAALFLLRQSRQPRHPE